MKRIIRKFLSLGLVFLFTCLLILWNNISKGQAWPPNLPTANEHGVATLTGPDLLQVPSSVQHVLDSTSDAQLTVAKVAPKVELVYFNQLPNIICFSILFHLISSIIWLNSLKLLIKAELVIKYLYNYKSQFL